MGIQASKQRISQSVLLFIFCVFWAGLLLTTVIVDFFLLNLLPFSFAIGAAAFSGIMLFKKDLNGESYGRALMAALSCLMVAILLSGIFVAVNRGSFPLDLLGVGALVLFLICLIRNNTDESSWKILNYIGLSILVLQSAIDMAVAFEGASLMLTSKVAGWIPAAIVYGVTGLAMADFLAFSIVSLVYTKDQPLEY